MRGDQERNHLWNSLLDVFLNDLHENFTPRKLVKSFQISRFLMIKTYLI